MKLQNISEPPPASFPPFTGSPIFDLGIIFVIFLGVQPEILTHIHAYLILLKPHFILTLLEKMLKNTSFILRGLWLCRFLTTCMIHYTHFIFYIILINFNPYPFVVFFTK